MSLRWCLFGYEIKNNQYIIKTEEAKIVKNIFFEYIKGASFKEIADSLTRQNIVYNEEKSVWNKNMISRIIANQHYSGDEQYSPIISDEVYFQAEKIRNSRGGKRPPDSEEMKFLKNHFICSECSGTMHRIGKYSAREKWLCINGCRKLKYIDDSYLNSEMKLIINRVIENPELLYQENTYHKHECVIPCSKAEREIVFMSDQPGAKFNEIKDKIFLCAENKFRAYSDENMINVTEELIKFIKAYEKVNTMDLYLLKTIVKKIAADKNGNINVTFINNKTVGSEDYIKNE